MEKYLCFSDKERIAHEILAYFMDHPDAQDTLEGIVQWWLLERKIKEQRNLVQEALAELVHDALVLEVPVGDSRTYRMNRNKHEEIRAFLHSGCT